MKAFIVITFLGLFLAFYEMSGGSEFEPGASPFVEKELIVPDEPAAAPQVAEAPAPAPQPEIVASAPATSVDNATPAATEERVAVRLTPAEPQTTEEKAEDLTTTERSLTTDGSEDGLVFTSLGQSPETFLTQPQGDTAAVGAGPEATAEQASTADLRIVTATRVNVRGGPGTSFDIISKVARDDQVEVLRSESGWVRLRTPEGRVGWMAERFLVPVAN